MNTILLACIEERTGSKYIRIADGIEEAVGKGKLRPGERLPPQRELADQLGVTLGTVSRGYREAEKRGILQGETGRGTFVRSSEKDSFSLHSLHNLPDRDSMPLVQFDLNFPVRAGHPDLAALLRELSSRVDLDLFLDYRPTAGLRQHRMTAAKWLGDFGLSVPFEQVAVTAGVQHGLLAALTSLMQAGEVLAVEQYTYPGMLNLANHLGIRLLPVPMDDNGVRPGSLASLARKHRIRGLYLMSNLQNPTTITMPEAHSTRSLSAV
jgi:DNA-binding transcriptional MocR family regulator